MTELTKQELEETLNQLEKIRGRHTELVSVYVPEGYDINSVQRQLQAEKSTAKNIKSTATRKNVIDALDKIVRHLKTLKKTPKNGLALFSGNVSRAEGQQDIKLWDIEPPTPLKNRLYRCDKEFVLGPLKEILEVDEVFGLVVMDRKEATIGLLEGKRIEVIRNITSGVPSKVRAGGQCLSPEILVYLKSGSKKIKEIETDEEIRAFDLLQKKIVFTKVKNKWEVVKDKYLKIVIHDRWSILASEDHTFFKDVGKADYEVKEVLAKDLEVGDQLITFDQNKEIFTMDIKEIKKKDEKISLIDIETEIGNFFAEGFLVHNSSQRFHRITEGLTKEFYKRIAGEVKKIFFHMKKLKGIIIGGPIPTKDEFIDGEYLTTQLGKKIIGKVDVGDTSKSGLNELVEKSQDLLVDHERIQEKKIVEDLFKNLGENKEKTLLKEEEINKALELGAVDKLFISSEIDKTKAKELSKMAKAIGSQIKIISTETSEGEQFFNMGGIAVILRFRV